MAEAPRNDLDPLLLRGLVTDLVAPASPADRGVSVARARQHVAARRYEDGEVVHEIATQLLALSHA